jgi:hypothetical protein
MTLLCGNSRRRQAVICKIVLIRIRDYYLLPPFHNISCFSKLFWLPITGYIMERSDTIQDKDLVNMKNELLLLLKKTMGDVLCFC